MAYGVKKSRITPCHPMGDGLVKRMNRSLLSLLRTYTEREGDWEEHLQLFLYLYRSTKHAGLVLSPYEVLFGVNPPSLCIPRLLGAAAPNGKWWKPILWSLTNDSVNHTRGEGTCNKLQIGQKVLLNNPTKGKLDPLGQVHGLLST